MPTTTTTKTTATKTTATKNKPKSQRSSRSRKPQDGKNSRQQIEEAVADRIIELLDQGKLPPWEKDWQDSPYGFPVNTVSMKPYRGVNRWMTLLTQNIMGYTDPRWLTYRQAEALGGHVRKGENSTTVVFWKRVTSRRDREEGRRAKIREAAPTTTPTTTPEGWMGRRPRQPTPCSGPTTSSTSSRPRNAG